MTEFRCKVSMIRVGITVQNLEGLPAMRNDCMGYVKHPCFACSEQSETRDPTSPGECRMIILQHLSAVIVNILHSGVSSIFANPNFILQTAPHTGIVPW